MNTDIEQLLIEVSEMLRLIKEIRPELPRLLDARFIKQEFFNGKNGMPNLSLPGVYNLMKREDCPVIKIGNKLYSPSHLFVKWLDELAVNRAAM